MSRTVQLAWLRSRCTAGAQKIADAPMKQQEGGRGDLPPPLQHRRRGERGAPPTFRALQEGGGGGSPPPWIRAHIFSWVRRGGGVPPSPAPRIDPTKNEQTIGLDPANSFESFMTSQFVFSKACWKYSSSNLTGAQCERDRTCLGD